MENTEIKMENKAVPIKFDDLSKEILKNCNPIMRETLINMGVRMVANSSIYNMYFVDTAERKNKFLNTLSEAKLEDINDLDTESTNASNTSTTSNTNTSNTPEDNSNKESIIWDDFS